MEKIRIEQHSSIGLIWIAGWLFGGHEWTKPTGHPVSVALIQGAIPQDEKWLESNRAATLEKFRGLNREALGARIIVWPEPLRAAQRRTEATQSAAVTAAPSENFRPSRNSNV